MSAKSVTKYVCSNCGAVSLAWAGRCSVCGEWNSYVEEVAMDTSKVSSSAKTLSSNVYKSKDFNLVRYKINEPDIDEVFGGGLVPGSVNLMAGQPGVGKSTLLLQIADKLSQKISVLYVSGEESAQQISSRAERLKLSGKFELAISTSADDIAKTISSKKFQIVIIDSIQTMQTENLNSSSGTVSQVTGSSQIMSAAAKQSDTALIIAGHVTKEGSIAGPKILEHMVDVVLQLDGDTYGGFKVLRASKNRYGSTNNTAILEMTEQGLSVVSNPSAALLEERQNTDGSIVFATIEGSRPLLVEIQALVNRTNYGYPKRAASGLDLNRLNLLIAMLERRTKLNLIDQDIYLNVVGGIRINEPAADLAVCMAIASAAKGMKLDTNTVVFGEVGLSGEVRRVSFIDKRIDEASKLGFKDTIGPVAALAKLPKSYHAVKSVRQALNEFLEKN